MICLSPAEPFRKSYHSVYVAVYLHALMSVHATGAKIVRSRDAQGNSEESR